MTLQLPPRLIAAFKKEAKRNLEKRDSTFPMLFVFSVRRPHSSLKYGVLLQDGTVIGVRITMLVCDQKQERGFLCLKGAGSYADCSHCLMPFRENEKVPPIDTAEDEANGEDDESSSDDGFLSSEDIGSVPPVFSIRQMEKSLIKKRYPNGSRSACCGTIGSKKNGKEEEEQHRGSNGI